MSKIKFKDIDSIKEYLHSVIPETTWNRYRERNIKEEVIIDFFRYNYLYDNQYENTINLINKGYAEFVSSSECDIPNAIQINRIIKYASQKRPQRNTTSLAFCRSVSLKCKL